MKSINVKDLGRIREIATVLAKHGFGHVLQRTGLQLELPAAAVPGTAPYARRLRLALTELGPTFVKFGQILSLRPDILPPDVLAEFESLQRHVAPMGPVDVAAVLENELSRPVDEVFTEFDMTPLGSASIAQVHAAVLLSGERVAVKLQRRGIEPVIRSDLHILYTLANLLEGRIRIPGMYTPVAIVREFDAAITLELDFIQELKATQRMARNLRDTGVVVPEVFDRWSTRRVMVMEHIAGVPLAQAAVDLDRASRRALAHQLMDATYRQVFENGFFHGDPHPGNLFVTPEGKLAYLDFGVTGVLTASMQDTILSTFTALVFRDPDTLAQTILRAGATHGKVDLREFRTALEAKMAVYHGAALDDLAQRDTLMEVVELATRFHITLPSEFAILARAMTLVEGNVRRLLPDVGIVDEVRPYAERLMKKRFAPDRILQDIASTLFQLQGQARELPTQASQVLADLDAGRLEIITRNPDAAALREEIKRGVTRLSLAAVASTATFAALLLLRTPAEQLAGVPGWDVLFRLLLLAGMVAFVSLGLHVVFGYVPSPRQLRASAWRLLRFFAPRRDG